jgi:hypothetical protein
MSASTREITLELICNERFPPLNIMRVEGLIYSPQCGNIQKKFGLFMLLELTFKLERNLMLLKKNLSGSYGRRIQSMVITYVEEERGGRDRCLKKLNKGCQYLLKEHGNALE